MVKRFPAIRIILFVGLMWIIQLNLFAANYYSITSGNWNSPSTWSSIPGGPAGTSIPSGNNDDVFIENGHIITVTAGANCGYLTFTGYNATLTINSAVTLTVKFDLTLNKLFASNSSCTLTGSGTIDCKDIVVGSSANPSPTTGNSTYTHTINSSVAILLVSNDITINSYFGTDSNIRNGVFNLESGNVTVERNITTVNQNGSNNSTFSMATGAQTGTLILTWSNPFTLSATGVNVMTLNGSSSVVKYSRNGAQTVLATTYSNITLANTGAKTITGITVNGILSREGTATAAGTTPTYGTSSAIQYKGSSAQTTGIEFPDTFSGSQGVIIDNTSGVTLNSDRTVTYLLTFLNGLLNTGTFTLSVGIGGSVTGAGNGKYVNGNLRKGIAAGTSSKTFEIGDATSYTPIDISFTGSVTTAGEIFAKSTPGDHPNIATSTFNAGVTVNRYWTLTNSGVAGFTAYRATFHFVPGDVDTGADFNYFYAGNYSLGTWTYPALGTLASTSTQVTGLTSFGDFQIGERPIASFRSRQTGDWNQTSSWESFDGTSWIPATGTPSSTSGYITVRSAHVITNTTAVTVDQLIIDAGGKLNLASNMTVNDGPAIDYTVNGTLDCSTFILTGAGSFLLDIDADMIIGSSQGITSSGAAGNIQTTTRTFSTAGNYTYNGSAAQVTGNGLPGALNNLTINNPSGVILGSPTIINGTLNLANGVFSVAGMAVTFQNSDIPLTRTLGTITTSETTDISFGTPANTAGASFGIPPGIFTTPPTINSLTLNRINDLTLNDQLMSVKTYVLCNGILNSSGNLLLKSDAFGTAYIDGSGTGQVSGSVTMERYLPSGFGYRYISSPFQSATVSELSDEINLANWFPLVYRYDENRTSSGWVSHVNPAADLNPLQGYAANFGSVAIPVTVNMTGFVNDGALSVTLYNHDNSYTKGFNLIGNPYPSPIDWDSPSGWTRSNIDDAAYFFRPSATDQYGGTYSSYVNGIPSDGTVTSIIPSMQGFYVHVSDGTYPVTGFIDINDSVRVNNITQPFYKSVKSVIGEDLNLLRLTIAFDTDTSSKDPLVIYSNENASDLFDSKYDALKLMNTDLRFPNLYAVNPGNSKLSVCAVAPPYGSGLTIPLGVKLNIDGNVIFRISKVSGTFKDMEIVLVDSLYSVRKVISGGGEFRISLPRAEYLNRFYLTFNALSTGENTPESITRDLQAWVSDGIIKVNISELSGGNGIIYITNIAGQKLLESSVYNTGYHEFEAPAKNGVYIMTLVSGGKRSIQKFIISR